LTVSKQIELLDRAISEDLPFAEVLGNAGWSYDDLVYKESHTRTASAHRPLALDDVRTDPHRVPFVSFFTGAGGIDLGLEAAGFSHVAAFEVNELFCKTLRRNRPSWNIFGPPSHSGDVAKADEIAAALDSLV